MLGFLVIMISVGHACTDPKSLTFAEAPAVAGSLPNSATWIDGLAGPATHTGTNNVIKSWPFDQQCFAIE